MKPHEALEHLERAEEVSRHEAASGRHAGVLISILAALLAIASLAGNRASSEAILAQAMASDTYNEYQANSLKRHINLDDAALLRISSHGTADESAASALADQLEQAVRDKYQPAQDELLPEARALEAQRDHASMQHRGFELAEAALQLAIVLASISIIACSVRVLAVGAALGVLGVLLLVNGYLLLVTPFF